MTLIKLNVGAKNQLEQNRTEQTVTGSLHFKLPLVRNNLVNEKAVGEESRDCLLLWKWSNIVFSLISNIDPSLVFICNHCGVN